MQRYFLKDLCNNNPVFYEQDVLHIKKVMRFKINDEIEIAYDDKVYLGTITSINPLKVVIKNEIVENHELNGYLRLLYCIPKGNKLDLVIQKCTELGVNEIVLVNSSRTIAKFDNDSFKKKINRFNLIIKEASEQSKRTKLTKLDKLVDINDVIKFKADINLVAYEGESDKNIDILNKFDDFKGKIINILIGAEGGFSKEEINYLKENGYLSISLGKRILRSETACICLTSILSLFMN